MAKALVEKSEVKHIVVHLLDSNPSACMVTAMNMKQLQGIFKTSSKYIEIVTFNKKLEEFVSQREGKTCYASWQKNHRRSQPTRKDLDHKYTHLVSNPPYLSYQCMLKLQEQVKMYEDAQALDGKSFDGLQFARSILAKAHLLIPPGKHKNGENGKMFTTGGETSTFLSYRGVCIPGIR